MSDNPKKTGPKVIYRQQGNCINGRYIINAYINGVWVMTYNGYYHTGYTRVIYPAIKGNPNDYTDYLAKKRIISIFDIGQEK